MTNKALAHTYTVFVGCICILLESKLQKKQKSGHREKHEIGSDAHVSILQHNSASILLCNNPGTVGVIVSCFYHQDYQKSNFKNHDAAMTLYHMNT